MNGHRLTDYFDHMLEASHLACSYIEGMGKEDFVADKRTPHKPRRCVGNGEIGSAGIACTTADHPRRGRWLAQRAA